MTMINEDRLINNLADVAAWLRDRQHDGDEHLKNVKIEQTRVQVLRIQAKFKQLADVVDAHIATEQPAS